MCSLISIEDIIRAEHAEAGDPEFYAGGLYGIGRDVARRRDVIDCYKMTIFVSEHSAGGNNRVEKAVTGIAYLPIDQVMNIVTAIHRYKRVPSEKQKHVETGWSHLTSIDRR